MDIIESLCYTITRGTKKEADELRKENIVAFSEIPRADDLEFGVKERRLLLHETGAGEKILIQFPGKETKSGNLEKIRPWDFRPKLQLSSGDWMKDLSFADIWDDLSELKNLDDKALSELAAIFYRMSVMIDHTKVDTDYQIVDIDAITDEILGGGSYRMRWNKYQPNPDVIDDISNRIGNIRGASLEAYLMYNDLLVQNEDCKYFYRDTVVREGNWKSDTGRKNTLLSHLTVIEFIEGRLKFSEIMNRFQRGMGVAPIPVKEISGVTGGIIEKA